MVSKISYNVTILLHLGWDHYGKQDNSNFWVRGLNPIVKSFELHFSKVVLVFFQGYYLTTLTLSRPWSGFCPWRLWTCIINFVIFEQTVENLRTFKENLAKFPHLTPTYITNKTQVKCSWIVCRGDWSRSRDSSETFRVYSQTRWASHSKSRSQIQGFSSLALHRRDETPCQTSHEHFASIWQFFNSLLCKFLSTHPFNFHVQL